MSGTQTLWRLSAHETAGLVNAREASAQDIVDADTMMTDEGGAYQDDYGDEEQYGDEY